MSTTVRRFFKTEDHPLIQTVQAMFDHRAAADAEAQKLAASIGAEKAWWHGRTLGGFSFKQQPLGKMFYMVAREPVPIYMPAAGVGTGKKILEQMALLSVPLYPEAFITHNLFMKNYIKDLMGRVHTPQLSFNQMSLKVEYVIAGVPYFPVGSPAALVPNRDPSAVADYPPPEGFHEMTKEEVRAYAQSQEVTRQ